MQLTANEDVGMGRLDHLRRSVRARPQPVELCTRKTARGAHETFND